MITRRTFLVTGVAGAATLATAYWMQRGPSSLRVARVERAESTAVLNAIAPVMLQGALPEKADLRNAAVLATVQRVHAAMESLPMAAQRELAQLFALLTWAPTRLALTGLSLPWTAASAGAVDEALAALRDSSLALKRSAYGALHQLVLGAWYASPEAWNGIGYPGPPALGHA